MRCHVASRSIGIYAVEALDAILDAVLRRRLKIADLVLTAPLGVNAH
jgi:hypothetical protein